MSKISRTATGYCKIEIRYLWKSGHVFNLVDYSEALWGVLIDLYYILALLANEVARVAWEQATLLGCWFEAPKGAYSVHYGDIKVISYVSRIAAVTGEGRSARKIKVIAI